MVAQYVRIGFCGLTVAFAFPAPMELPDSFASLLTESGTPEDTYTVELLTAPLRPSAPPVAVTDWGTQIFQTEKGWLHIHPSLEDSLGCQVACLFCPDGHHRLYYPVSQWPKYRENWNAAHLLWGERLLLRHDGLLLHSSLVHYQGKSVLFSGPSGAGKSTQASLWHTHLGAEIINGDRTVIRKTADGFIGGGSIWSGSSGIYRPDFAPIAGIILVEHGETETLERLGFTAFKPLLTQTIVNSWDEVFMHRITGLLGQLMDTVPIYRLRCRPTADAVAVVRDALFTKEDCQ